MVALRSFRDVCRIGSISLAAQSLGYTQSAVSRQVATLESELGVRLLTRHARGVRPTPAGEALLAHAAAILSRAERAVWQAPIPLDLGAANSVGSLAQYVMTVPGAAAYWHAAIHLGKLTEVGAASANGAP